MEKSQFHIDITDKWIIQIAYDTLIIMAKLEDNIYIKQNIMIDRPGTISI